MKVPTGPVLSKEDIAEISLRASMFPGSTISGVQVVPGLDTWAVALSEDRRPRDILIGEGSLAKFTKPMWSAATYHEAAHSSVTYYTPKSEDWPKQLCQMSGNILEDFRMERDIEMEYPGMIPSFELLNNHCYDTLKKSDEKRFVGNVYQLKDWRDVFNAALVLKLGRYRNARVAVAERIQEIEMPNKTKRILNLEEMWKDAHTMMDEYIHQPCGFFEPETMRKSSNRYATNKLSAFLDKYGWVARNEMEKAKEFEKKLKELLKQLGMSASVKKPGQQQKQEGQPQPGAGKPGEAKKDGQEQEVEGAGKGKPDDKDPKKEGKGAGEADKDKKPEKGEDEFDIAGSNLEEAERTKTDKELEREIHDLLQEMAPKPGGNGYCDRKLGSLFDQSNVKNKLAEVTRYFPVSPPPGAGYRFEQTARKRFRASDGDLDFDAVVAWNAAAKPKGMMLAKDSVAQRKTSGELHHPPPPGKDFPIKRIAVYLDLSGSMYAQVSDMIAFSAAFALFARKHKVDTLFVVGDQGLGLVRSGNPQDMNKVLEMQMGNSGNTPTWTKQSMQDAYKWAKEKGRIIFITDRAIPDDENRFIDKVLGEKLGICTYNINIKDLADVLWMRKKPEIKHPNVNRPEL